MTCECGASDALDRHEQALDERDREQEAADERLALALTSLRARHWRHQSALHFLGDLRAGLEGRHRSMPELSWALGRLAEMIEEETTS